MPQVSIVIPTYNRVEYLKQAIASCLDPQASTEIEVVVVDDGSSDGSIEWLNSLDDRRVRVMRQTRRGAPVARNTGLQSSTAPLIKFLDDDYVLEPGSLDVQLTRMSDLTAREIPYGRVQWIDADGAAIGETRHRPRAPGEDPVIHVMYNNIMTAAPLHRREALLEVGGFDPTLDSAQEYELHLRLAATGYVFRYFDDVVYHQRHHRAETRISNTNRLVADPLHAMIRLDRIHEMLRRVAGGRAREEWIRELARMYWSYGREMLRTGNTPVARQYFAKARELAGRHCLPDPWYYRLSARLIGAAWAERLSSTWLRLLKRRPVSALDLSPQR